MNNTRTTIIVAGGKGERMNASVPKQFLELNGRPILMHTLDVFHQFDNEMLLILVLPSLQIEYWKELCKKHAFVVSHQIVAGGTTRFQSVKNGLKVVRQPSLVAVHDGVRPLVSLDTIDSCFMAAEKYGAAIPVCDVFESIRRVTSEGNVAVDRSLYKLVQTPQIFTGELLLKAYNQDFSPLFTDDASVVESIGHKVELVSGNRENIKITTPNDMLFAEALLKSAKF